jgi:hypothetical protein
MDDPWTFFGSFSREEADVATALLQKAAVIFEIKEDSKWVKTDSGWSGPFTLWVHDEHAGLASSILVPHFQKTK